MDNRPRWMMGGLRDDTGATNNSTIFTEGYGLDMTTHGAKTLQPGYNVKLGRSTYTDKGKTQTEYSNWSAMEQGKDKETFKSHVHNFKNPG